MKISARLLVLAMLAGCSGSPPSSMDSGNPNQDSGVVIPPVTCTLPQIACGQLCVDPRLDKTHCGACDTVCAEGKDCGGAQCLPNNCVGAPCAVGQVCLTDVCVDRLCVGVVCMSGEQCAAGKCAPQTCSNVTCGPAQVCQANECVDLACVGVQCGAGLSCRAGLCVGSSCGNGLKDGSETDVDCGGTCALCGVGQACLLGTDCGSGSCTTKVCSAAAGCADGKKSGTETDVDCGGRACLGCGGGGICLGGADCVSRMCLSGACTAPTCLNQARDGNETDVDCGGTCGGCGAGRACLVNGDCLSGSCLSSTCMAPASCSDTLKNGLETAVDCGGPACGPCGAGQGCLQATDCVSGQCNAGACAPGSCSDGMKNGAETGIDCGGPQCASCVAGLVCNMPKDCQSGVCQGGVCQQATCFDLTLNATETDVDCGGPATSCPRCVPMQLCNAATDCNGGACVMGKCQAPTCTDGLRNQDETDRDCGGSSCPACQVGKSCLSDSHCVSRRCVSNICIAPTCTDGFKNGTEADIDCGGGCPARCLTGRVCNVDGDCEYDYCSPAKVCAITRARYLSTKMPDSSNIFCVNQSGPGACPTSVDPLYGQDGNFQVNVPTYTLTTDTTTDSVTGLTWERVGLANTPAYSMAYAYCAGLNLGGFSDWRIPTRLELVSILDYSHMNAIDPLAFPGFPTFNNGPYVWTSTSLSLLGQSFVGVDFKFGGTILLGTNYVFATTKCVRGNATAVTPMYTTTADTVTDGHTGLVWQRVVSSTTNNWGQAIAYCNNFSAGTLTSGWRLPNAKELLTIVEETASPVTIDLTVFPGTPAAPFWSSSTMQLSSVNAIAVDFASGLANGASVSTVYRARCVH